MKRMICFLLLGICLLFSGFQTKRVQSRYVTQIEISGKHNGIDIQRSYTEEEKMRSVLMYLRLLETGKIPSAIPDAEPTDVYRITVHLSNGEQRNYTQVDHRYFRKSTSGWESIPPNQATKLYSLMRFYESDV